MESLEPPAVENNGIFYSNGDGTCGGEEDGGDMLEFDVEFVSEDSTRQ